MANKAACCLLQLEQFGEAAEECLKGGVKLTVASSLDCRPNALNAFMTFQCYCAQQKNDQGISGLNIAIDHLQTISFSERSDLYLSAADIAFQNDNKPLLLSILRLVVHNETSLLTSTESKKHILIIMRCLIRLMDAKFKTGPFDEKNGHDLIGYIKKGINLLTLAYLVVKLIDPSESMYQTEVEWLYRTIWNSSFSVHVVTASLSGGDSLESQIMVYELLEMVGNVIDLLPSRSPGHEKSLQKRYAFNLI